jgi:hypothetical protein
LCVRHEGVHIDLGIVILGSYNNKCNAKNMHNTQ